MKLIYIFVFLFSVMCSAQQKAPENSELKSFQPIKPFAPNFKKDSVQYKMLVKIPDTAVKYTMLIKKPSVKSVEIPNVYRKELIIPDYKISQNNL